jgi:hypothetical protein
MNAGTDETSIAILRALRSLELDQAQNIMQHAAPKSKGLMASASTSAAAQRRSARTAARRSHA